MTAAQRTENENLFAQGKRPAPSVGTIVLFVIAAACVFGGFVAMGYAFDIATVSETPVIEPGGYTAALTFAAGLILDAIGFYLAFGLIPSREKAALR